MYDFDELQKLLDFTLPEEEKFRAQEVPRIQQGLLGSSGDQNRQMEELIQRGRDSGEQLAQFANAPIGSNVAEQRMTATQQQARQALADRGEQQLRTGALLGKIASLFIPGGGLFKFIKSKF